MTMFDLRSTPTGANVPKAPSQDIFDLLFPPPSPLDLLFPTPAGHR